MEIASDELPAGIPAGFALNLDRVHDFSRPTVELGCESGELRKRPGTHSGDSGGGRQPDLRRTGISLSLRRPRYGRLSGLQAVGDRDSGPGRPQRRLRARTRNPGAPARPVCADTSEKVGDASYAGSVDGLDLDVIEKVGWDATNGLPVDAIPTPVPGGKPDQNLRVVMPWPAPGPHAAALYLAPR